MGEGHLRCIVASKAVVVVPDCDLAAENASGEGSEGGSAA
jgi:hypothetical protein